MSDNTYITLTFDLETLFKIIAHFSLKHSVAKVRERFCRRESIYGLDTNFTHRSSMTLIFFT